MSDTIKPFKKPTLPADPKTFDLAYPPKNPAYLSLIDRVYAYMMRLIAESEAFRVYIEATTDMEAVEGGIYEDDLEAAALIRAVAKEERDAFVANKTKKALATALRYAMNRREGLSRKARAAAAAAEEIVTPPAGE